MNAKQFLVIFAIMCIAKTVFAEAQWDGLLGLSLADEMEIDTRGTLDSDPALFLGARYFRSLSTRFAFNTGLTLDSPRDLGSAGKLGFIAVFGNIVFDFKSYGHNMYAFLGLNLPFLIYEDKNLGEVNPSLGFQLGTGYRFTKKLTTELFFRTINFEIAGHDSELWGFGLLVAYTFSSF